MEVSFLQTIVFGDVLLEALVKIADGANYIMNMIDAVEQIIDKAKELCTGAGYWWQDSAGYWHYNPSDEEPDGDDIIWE